MSASPRILAIETSGRHGSVAVAAGPTVLAMQELPATSRHAIGLMPAIRDLTEQQGWKPAEIEHLYLSLGPGSFTGLRIAVAIAHALHQASPAEKKLRVVGVPSLDVIAQNAPLTATIVLPVLDAKRNQIFSARYERASGGTLIEAASAALVDPAAFLQQAIVRAEQLAAEAAGAKVQIALLGEGLDYHRAALVPGELPQGVEVVELSREFWHARATAVHQLGFARAQQNQFSDPASLLPLYIRLPEAEEVYRRKHGLPLH